MTPEQAAELRKPFPKSAIGKLPKAGVQLDYVGHAATTDRLLAVDPKWTYQIVSLDDTGQPLPVIGKGLWIKLTVGEVTRYGYGDGASIKECIGDAIRNAAMRFGVALDLWSKEELEQAHGPAAAPPPVVTVPNHHGGMVGPADTSVALLNTSSALAKAMYAAIREAGITDEYRPQFLADTLGRPIASSKEMTDADARRVLDVLKEGAA